MEAYNWNGWYSGFGYMLWFGMIFLFFSSFGNWGYTYQAHRKYSAAFPKRSALDTLDHRYAAGEIKREEYQQMKLDLAREKLQVQPV